MQNIRNITDKILWVGASDRRLHLFENMFPIPDGVAYNSYVSWTRRQPSWTLLIPR